MRGEKRQQENRNMRVLEIDLTIHCGEAILRLH